MSKTAIIIGAGPAGLTAAYELLLKTDIKPVILEKSGDIGGLSKTVNYKGNRMDIGGHRFFSKSDRVMNWWLTILPLEPGIAPDITLHYQNKEKTFSAVPSATAIADTAKTMLLRKRVSRIYYLKKFFSYPVTLSIDTIRKLGLLKITRIFFSYTYSKFFPRKQEKSLEDFFINRFGNNLYRTFFKDYTEKVWGVPCSSIPAEWGAQRIKELSITKALAHALRSTWPFRKKQGLAQKDTTTSLIQNFLYPKYGPGQLWEEVAAIIVSKGGEIHYHQEVSGISSAGQSITAVETLDGKSGQAKKWEGDYFFSTMPVQQLIAGMGNTVPAEIAGIAADLQYRDFITAGLLLKKLTAQRKSAGLDDNWIYIQEKEVKVGRLQLFNNWSPYMVKDPDTLWVGLEYFCSKGDAFWELSDEAIIQTAIDELVKIDLIKKEDVLDHTVIRMEKTYPAYFGAYAQFDRIRAFTDSFPNLFLVGRNGMHKYNNADHSMLTAMTAVENIINGTSTKDNIWSINTEQDYQG